MTDIMYFDVNGVNEIAERKALGWLINQTGERVILAHQNSNLEAFLERIFAEANVSVKKFIHEKRIVLNSGNINLHTKRNPLPANTQASVLLLYPDKETLEQLQNYSNLVTIVIIPWRMDECLSWLRQQGARQIE